MGLSVEFIRGRERLEATSRVLQRARLADPTGGVWEAADVQWWWRVPRATDGLSLPVWSDEAGPCAAVSLVDWGSTGGKHGVEGDRLQADLFVVAETIDFDEPWSALAELLDQHQSSVVEVVAPQDDRGLTGRLTARGFAPAGDPVPIMWMAAANRPPVVAPPAGFRIVDRASSAHRSHPLGSGVEKRLQACSLYDPRLDFAAVAPGGEVAGHALFWRDPVTGVGMLEPMRVQDAYQRRGLARALLALGLDRLTLMGVRRIKVTFSRYAGHDLHARGAFTTTGSVQMFTSTRRSALR